MVNNFWLYIAQSIKTPTGKISITRISSYFILATILIGTLVLFGIDVSNAIISYRKGEIYTIPSEHLWAFGMVLAHHLALLGINKTAETKEAVTGINMGIPQPNFNNMSATGSIQIDANLSAGFSSGGQTSNSTAEDSEVSATPETTSEAQPKAASTKSKTTRSSRAKNTTANEDEGKTFDDPDL